MKKQVSVSIGGKTITMETGVIAKQADGAILISSGDTKILVTACMSDEPREGIDFFPLVCDYKEHTFSAGKIPGGFFKREGKPSTKEVLTSRLIDRPLRPLFPENFFNEVQVIANVYSFDSSNEPEVLAITAASCALYVSKIPFTIPVGAVRVGYVDGQFVVNPSHEEREKSILDLVVAGTEYAIVMVEAGAKEVSNQLMIEALEFAHAHIKELVKAQKELFDMIKPEKVVVEERFVDQVLFDEVEKEISDKLLDALRIKGKLASNKAVKELKKKLIESYEEELQNDVAYIFDTIKEKLFRNYVLNEGKRLDGRAFDEIRPVNCEVGVMPRTHGSALFTRGETQALVTTTLGTFGDSQLIDGLEGEEEEKFMLHYNFPPFSVGEVRPLRGPGRREIGHGALAKRAIEPMIPEEEEFPYIIRVVSEILESNGSSSMATVCGGTLSLMDAGVPLKKPVAGIAMGLVKEGDKYAILTDIAGAEDHYGDMDFKVAGTKDGITALQMDIKIKGLTKELMAEALEQARRAIDFLLEKMTAVIPEPRKELSPYAPRITELEISTDKIRDLIGPGGKTIKEIVDSTGVKIEIKQDGKVLVAATNEDASRKAIELIKAVTAVPEVGKVYEGIVKRIEDYGAFVEILPGKEGLLHKSEIANHFVRNVADELKLNQKVLVIVKDIDNLGRVNLSRKPLLKDDESENRTGNRDYHNNQRNNRPRHGNYNRDNRNFRNRDNRDKDEN